MKLYSKLMLAGCVCIATMAFSTSVAQAQTGACCLPNGTCQSATALSCTVDLMGHFNGNGSICLGDANGDGIDDACQTVVPAVSNFGLAALVILVLAAGVIAIRRGRRVSAGG